MRDSWRSIRQKLEAPLVLLGVRFIARLPRRVIVRLSKILGAISYGVSAKLRRIGMANLDLVFGDTKTLEEKRRILRKSFESFSLVLLDLFWFSHDSRARMEKYVHYNDKMEWFFEGQAQICLTGHIGNWELAGRAVSCRGFPLASVASPLKNPVVDALLIKARETTGQVIIPRQGAIKNLLSILRKGGKVALLLDQNTLPSEGGKFIPFFGVPATVAASAEALALRTGAEILLGFCVPCGGGHYQTVILDRFIPSDSSAGKKEAEASLTEAVTRSYEEAIRQYPEYWLWTYKRWKFIQPGDSAARYPFYARRLKEANA